ncbi:hypothetical protein FGK63_01880 [Ruegeria sediminis]|uniref:Uncharacterized protein n=1 Tax=Ruegeria sediminis TaxID=2583820 RepID=A0ABY2X386_9RHOB|nr:hypothetical protein [Ruegeria sediminis]TMV09844.1 hypothetical protein FGK63_01880 [Ruegeria sediminis]
MTMFHTSNWLDGASDALDDSPVSGGVGAVLQRGRARCLADGRFDDDILVASPDDLAGLAQTLGVPVSALRDRQARLEAALARQLAE